MACNIPLKSRRFGIFFALVQAFFLMTLISALAELQGDTKAGKAIYEKNCASCHGKKGEGRGFLSTRPGLSDASYMVGKTDAELLDKIANGGKGTGMPAWKNVLSEQDRLNVLAYIRSLTKP
jgi:mono/diheme cytochrome c family protein